MTIYKGDDHSCAICSLNEIYDTPPTETFRKFYESWGGEPIVWFSSAGLRDSTGGGGVEKFLDFIEKHGLGVVGRAGKRVLNNKSGNYVQMYVWHPDEKKVDAYAKKKKVGIHSKEYSELW